MTLKLVLLFAFAVAAKASFIRTNQIDPTVPGKAMPTASVAVVQEVALQADEYDPHAQYKYSYSVEDKFTGDSKSQNEQRDGDVVHGEYSLIDPDGYKRTVKYTSDGYNGCNAVVERIPLVKIKGCLSESNVVKNVAPLGQFPAPIAAVRHVIEPVDPLSQYASRYTSYDAPIYLTADLLGSRQH